MTAATITTWANGYGTWYARVPAGDQAERVARKAIRKELAERGEIGSGVRLRVTRVLIAGKLGTVVYRETWPTR